MNVDGPSNADGPSEVGVTRREWFVGAAGAATVALAGCVGLPTGGDGADDGDDAGDGEDAEVADDQEGVANDGEDGAEDDADGTGAGNDDGVTDDTGTAVPEELPTDPGDEDFVDATGQDVVEIETREGGDGEPSFVFDPPFVRVDVETTVRWVNADGIFHTVTSTPSLEQRTGGGEVFDATISSVGDTVEWVTEESGRQDYYCSPHAGFMFGSIDVV